MVVSVVGGTHWRNRAHTTLCRVRDINEQVWASIIDGKMLHAGASLVAAFFQRLTPSLDPTLASGASALPLSRENDGLPETESVGHICTGTGARPCHMHRDCRSGHRVERAVPSRRPSHPQGRAALSVLTQLSHAACNLTRRLQRANCRLHLRRPSARGCARRSRRSRRPLSTLRLTRRTRSSATRCDGLLSSAARFSRL